MSEGPQSTSEQDALRTSAGAGVSTPATSSPPQSVQQTQEDPTVVPDGDQEPWNDPGPVRPEDRNTPKLETSAEEVPIESQVRTDNLPE